jgi:hypothetical protein
MTNTKTKTNTRVGGTVLARALPTEELTRGSGGHSSLGIPPKGAIMMMRRVVAMTVLILGMGVTAHAGILAAGALYGSPNQTVAACYLYNAGTGPVTITTKQIFQDGRGTPAISLVSSSDNCPVQLAANASCGIGANIVSIYDAHLCKFVVSPSTADVRGGFEIRAGASVLTNVDLH